MTANITNIKPADLFFTTSRNFFSWAIRQRTWGKFSHVQIITRITEQGKIEVVSADANGVCCRDAREEEFEHFAILTYPEMTDKEREDVCKFCFRQIGKPYDFVGLASFLLYKELQNDNWWFCSELAYVAYKQAGIRLQRRVKQDFISPRDLYISPLFKPIAGSPRSRSGEAGSPRGEATGNAEYDWK